MSKMRWQNPKIISLVDAKMPPTIFFNFKANLLFLLHKQITLTQRATLVKSPSPGPTTWSLCQKRSAESAGVCRNFHWRTLQGPRCPNESTLFGPVDYDKNQQNKTSPVGLQSCLFVAPFLDKYMLYHKKSPNLGFGYSETTPSFCRLVDWRFVPLATPVMSCLVFGGKAHFTSHQTLEIASTRHPLQALISTSVKRNDASVT